MNQFKDGQEIRTVYYADSHFGVGEGDCTKITVSMECGQMSGVPWFCIWYGDNIGHKLNGALVEGVRLFMDDKTE